MIWWVLSCISYCSKYYLVLYIHIYMVYDHMIIYSGKCIQYVFTIIRLLFNYSHRSNSFWIFLYFFHYFSFFYNIYSFFLHLLLLKFLFVKKDCRIAKSQCTLCYITFLYIHIMIIYWINTIYNFIYKICIKVSIDAHKSRMNVNILHVIVQGFKIM